MSAGAFLAAICGRVADAVRTWAPGARGAWCRRQRRRLRGSEGAVIWVRGTALIWAAWGARRGYFALEYMDGLAYLRSPPGTAA